MTVYSPRSISEACEIYAEHPDAHVLAGGTDFMVEVNFNHRKPTVVISLGKISELRQWSHNESTNEIIIGATMPFSVCEQEPLAGFIPALAQAARTVGSPQIRNAGSIGGNLGTASPAGDSLPVLSALDAMVETHSLSGSRRISIHDFLVGPKKNALTKSEFVTSIHLPIGNGPQMYAKVGVRNAMVISIASVCFAIQDNTPRVALGSVGPTVLRARQAEQFFSTEIQNASGPVSAEVFNTFAERVAEESRPIDDHRSTAQYRRHAVRTLARRLAEKSVTHV
jgi:CO/xanthine dehydrogenase FAD-binding subunit